MRLRLTLVHQERRMTHFATPLYNCRGLSVKLLQRGGMSENPVVKAEFKMSIGSVLFALFFTFFSLKWTAHHKHSEIKNHYM